MYTCKWHGETAHIIRWSRKLPYKTCKKCAHMRTEKWKKESQSLSAVEYRERQLERRRKKTKAKNAFLRARVLKEYGSRCGGCGETNEIVLDLDHINGRSPGSKRSWDTDYRKAIQLGSPNDVYQLLCRNCNWIKFRTGEGPVGREDEAVSR